MKNIIEIFHYILTPAGLFQLLALVFTTFGAILVYRQFKINYKKPSFKILEIQPYLNVYNKENPHCHMKFAAFNPASFQNTLYLHARNMFGREIPNFFYPKNEIIKIDIPANGDCIKSFDIYSNHVDKYKNSFIQICAKDSKGKFLVKYIKLKDKTL